MGRFRTASIFLGTVSHVEVTASYRDGVGMMTRWGRDDDGIVTLKERSRAKNDKSAVNFGVVLFEEV